MNTRQSDKAIYVYYPIAKKNLQEYYEYQKQLFGDYNIVYMIVGVKSIDDTYSSYSTYVVLKEIIDVDWLKYMLFDGYTAMAFEVNISKRNVDLYVKNKVSKFIEEGVIPMFKTNKYTNQARLVKLSKMNHECINFNEEELKERGYTKQKILLITKAKKLYISLLKSIK